MSVLVQNGYGGADISNSNSIQKPSPSALSQVLEEGTCMRGDGPACSILEPFWAFDKKLSTPIILSRMHYIFFKKPEKYQIQNTTIEKLLQTSTKLVPT